MTRFNDVEPTPDGTLATDLERLTLFAYREGVARAFEYIQSNHSFTLANELNEAIEEGIV